mgnify:CR=1 FL=1
MLLKIYSKTVTVLQQDVKIVSNSTIDFGTIITDYGISGL